MPGHNTLQEPADISARKQALDPDQSYICVAPAGSGKTELLTQRILVLLTRVQKPEEILAITFTRKAAAEMQHRVLSALQLALGAKPNEPHKQLTWQLAKAALECDRQSQWHLLDNPHRLSIRTFDGLCASLVKAMPLQAKIAGGVALADDSLPLFTQAAESLLGELESDGAVGEALLQLLQHMDNRYDDVVELLTKLLMSRSAWLPVVYAAQSSDIRGLLEANLQQLRAEHFAKLYRSVPESVAPQLCALADFAARHLPPESASPIKHCLQLTALPSECHLPAEDCLQIWQGLADVLLTKTGWRKTLNKNSGFPTEADGLSKADMKARKAELMAVIASLQEVPGLYALLDEVRNLPNADYDEAQWALLQALTLLLPRLVAHLQWVFTQTGNIDFTEMAMRAAQALGDEQTPTDLALQLDHRIQHILVDEFQDTSTQQMQLLQKLAAGWQHDDGRTLFCVGDAMQSIYAFRNANVGLFLRCLQGQLGHIALQPLALTTNFRSQAGVVEWVNRVFSEAFPARVDVNVGAVPFSRAEPFKPSAGRAVSYQAWVAETGLEALAHQGEAEWVAQSIQRIVEESPEATIAVLGRGRKELGRTLPALQAANIAYRAVDLDPLMTIPAVQDALALTRALLDTSDTIAWLSVLRAPWCGLQLPILTQLRQQPGCVLEQIAGLIRQFESQSLACPQPLLRVSPVLQRAVRERGRLSLASWVKGTWLALGGAAALSEADQHNVERYFDALAGLSSRELMSDSRLGITATLDRITQKLFALPAPGATDQIQVMTMHKSKGLEFDYVFLVGLGEGKRSLDRPLMRWHEQTFEVQGTGAMPDDIGADNAATAWLISPTGERGQDQDKLFQWLALQDKKRLNYEACRLLYVACTRAKQQLYLSGRLPPAKKAKAANQEAMSSDNIMPPDNIAAEPAAGSLLGAIWPAVADTVLVNCQRCEPPSESQNQAGNQSQAESQAMHSQSPFLRRLPSDWQAPTEMPLSEFKASGQNPSSFFIDTSVTNTAAIETAPKTALPAASVVASASIAPQVGVLVHEILEQCCRLGFDDVCYSESGEDESKTSKNKEDKSQKLAPGILAKVEQGLGLLQVEHGLPVADVASAQQQIVRCLGHALAPSSPLRQALVSAQEVHPEYSIETLNSDGQWQALRIDLWWRDSQGHIFIVDYKTASCDTSPTQFEAKQKQLYRPALAQYAKQLERLQGQPVTPILYLLDTNSWLPY